MTTIAEWAAQQAADAPLLTTDQKARLTELLRPMAEDLDRARRLSGSRAA